MNNISVSHPKYSCLTCCVESFSTASVLNTCHFVYALNTVTVSLALLICKLTESNQFSIQSVLFWSFWHSLNMFVCLLNPKKSMHTICVKSGINFKSNLCDELCNLGCLSNTLVTLSMNAKVLFIHYGPLYQNTEYNCMEQRVAEITFWNTVVFKQTEPATLFDWC